MHGKLGRAVGSLAEGSAFQGDSSALNPMRYVPSPAHTKFWQERTPLAQYINNEVTGTRMRRWERPIHDFIMPYARGLVERTTGQKIIPATFRTRDLNTLADVMTFTCAIWMVVHQGPILIRDRGHPLAPTCLLRRPLSLPPFLLVNPTTSASFLPRLIQAEPRF